MELFDLVLSPATTFLAKEYGLLASLHPHCLYKPTTQCGDGYPRGNPTAAFTIILSLCGKST